MEIVQQKQQAKVLLNQKELSAIYKYIETGQPEIIKSNIHQIQNINHKFLWGRTLLHYSAICDQKEIFDFLIQNQAKQNISDEYGWTPVQWAQNNGSFGQQKQLQPYQEDDLDLWDICETGQINLLKNYILTRSNIFKPDIRGVNGRTPLHLATISGHEDIVQTLLDNNASPLIKDQFGNNSIVYAQALKRVQIQKLFNQKNDQKNEINKDQQLSDISKQILEKEVIIIGAGAAGLGAAREFQKRGVKPLILEAQGQAGGRLKTVKFAGVDVDLGGQWVHCWSNRNQVANLIREINYPLNNRKGGIGWQFLDQEIGQKNIQENNLKAQQIADNLLQEAGFVAQQQVRDCSVMEIIKPKLDQVLQKNQNNPELNRLIIRKLYALEHYENASLSELSAKSLNLQSEGGGDITTQNGYGNLMKLIAQDLNVKYDQIVEKIDYSNLDKIQITMKNQQVYECQKLIVTIPLGVLKSNDIKFIPNLNPKKQKAIQDLGFGVMNKVFLEFKEKFWGNVHSISIAHDERGKNPFFYNLHPFNDKNILCLFLTDDFAKKSEQLSDQEIVESAIKSLQCGFGNKVSELVQYKVTRWGQNQFSWGSYSFYGVGSSIESCSDIQQPIEDRLFFAGEHCYSSCIGVAHGAFYTGIQAANNIIKIQLKQQNLIN